MGFTFKITYTRIVLNPVETLWRLPRVTHCEAAAALSQGCTEMRKALLAVGRCVWVWEGPKRRLCAENISLYERALSSSGLCQQRSERMHNAGEATPQITIRNEATALISLAEDLPDGLASWVEQSCASRVRCGPAL